MGKEAREAGGGAMTTTPLSPVALFLRRHERLGALEGAPRVTTDGELCAVTPDLLPRETFGDHLNLYLGTSEICPAAIGWAAEVLRIARSGGGVALLNIGGEIELWALGTERPIHIWTWDAESGAAPALRTVLPGPMPETPAERLKAVLEWEVSRG